MPSPFPGMDPHLENPAHWRGVHAALIVAIYEALNAALPDGFLARIEEACQRLVEIVALGAPEQVVTAIEVLSPSNKTPGDGREEYRRKQARYLRSTVHLLEIDLLRAGKHTVAASEDALKRRAGRWDYVISLHRAGEGAESDAWTRTVRDPLPTVPVPLTDGHPDVPLNLQEIVAHVWAAGPFRRAIDYTQSPEPPLRSEDAAWFLARQG
jgi:hypothetical protein